MTTEETSPSNDQVESSSPTEKACDEEWRKYRSNFPSISYMTSKELVQQEDKVMLVDVRTDAEQKVSMIPNSMTFEEWKQNELPKLIQADADDSSKKADNNKIVFYCTIGYRSGVEAKKFQDAYPDLKFYSLDGIVPYTQLGLPLVERNQTNKEEQPKETNRVHVFGPAWSKFANPEFDVVIFSKTKFLMEGIAVKFKQFFGGTK
ncbi:unnamed protein product [Cylindrotheca closterium]|uniref:Rhodanese domain-containing protein n=1 Tax=Cylindrotheca closterium TaxID=2856 RepID=A0AAD2FCY7_9STRA|nr:unnamed protein product [Cylindrotheca closterium]